MHVAICVYPKECVELGPGTGGPLLQAKRQTRDRRTSEEALRSYRSLILKCVPITYFSHVRYSKGKGVGKGTHIDMNTVNNLGNLYANQGKMEKAEQMYVQALQGYEKPMGLDHPRT